MADKLQLCSSKVNFFQDGSVRYSSAVPGWKFFDELLYLFCTLVFYRLTFGRKNINFPAIAKLYRKAQSKTTTI
jgi:hypothetical protein